MENHTLIRDIMICKALIFRREKKVKMIKQGTFLRKCTWIANSARGRLSSGWKQREKQWETVSVVLLDTVHMQFLIADIGCCDYLFFSAQNYTSTSAFLQHPPCSLGKAHISAERVVKQTLQVVCLRQNHQHQEPCVLLTFRTRCYWSRWSPSRWVVPVQPTQVHARRWTQLAAGPKPQTQAGMWPCITEAHTHFCIIWEKPHTRPTFSQGPVHSCTVAQTN